MVTFEIKPLLKGIKTLNTAVSSTLGPSGRNVLIEEDDGSIHITKDGVTVSKHVKSDNPIENIAIKLVRQSAELALAGTGDGTTTATLLTSELISEGVEMLEDGSNLHYLKKGIKDTIDTVITALYNMSTPIKTVEQLINIATISANGNEEVGKIVGELTFGLTNDGIINIAESNLTNTIVTTTKGYKFDKGLINNYFSTNATKNIAELNDCYVIIIDSKLRDPFELGRLLNGIKSANGSALIIADDVEESALANLIAMKVRGSLELCIVRTPDFGNAKKESLEDISIFTGGAIISKDRAISIANTTLSMLGRCKKVIVNATSTTLIEGSGAEDSINSRVDQIRNYITNDMTPYKIDEYKNRIAKLTTSVSEIKVGATSSVEMRNLKDVYDDAVGACMAAKKEGFVIGGGLALYNIAKTYCHVKTNHSSYTDGAQIVLNVISDPAIKIIENAGVNFTSILSHIEDTILEDNFWYNTITGKYCNFLEAGIIDPTYVTVTALKAACSIALEFLTINCVINK